MINEIYDLYPYISAGDIKENKYELELNEKFDEVIIIRFTKDLRYKGLSNEDYDIQKNQERYFYQKKVGNVYPYFPSLKLNKVIQSNKDVNEAALVRMRNSLLQHSDYENFDILVKSIEDNETVIRKELNKYNRGVYLLTLSIEENGEYKYIGNSSFFKKLVESYIPKEKNTTDQHRGVCALCHKNTNVKNFEDSEFKFYGKTDITYITYSAEGTKENAWKNFPICNECILKFKQAKQFVKDNMIYNFAGLSCYLLPQFLTNESKTNKQILKHFKFLRDNISNNTLRDKTPNIPDDEQKRITEYLSRNNALVNYSLYFYKIEKIKFTILSSIEGIYPSILISIDRSEQLTKDKFKTFNNNKNKKIPLKNISIINMISGFFSLTESKNKFVYKDKLYVLQNMFMNKKISKKYIYRFFNKCIKNSINNSSEKLNEETINKAEILNYFFYKLNILKP